MHITYSPNTLGKKVEGLCYLHGGFALDSFTYVEPLLPSILLGFHTPLYFRVSRINLSIWNMGLLDS
jgi:hypothetical protein